MKIIQIIQRPQLRGAEIFASQLGSELIGKGHQVILVSLFSGKANLPFKGKIIDLNLNEKKRLVDIKGWKILARQIKEFKADLVQANSGDTLKYAVLSRLLFGWNAPIVFRNASIISSYIRSWPTRAFNYFLFKRVNYVISVTRQTQADCIKLFPFLSNRIISIPIGLSVIHNIEGIKKSNYIVHVGGFTFEKNHEGLLRIVEKVFRENPEIQLVLVGDGPRRADIEAEVDKAGLKGRVKFLGFQSDVYPIIAEARVLILPSLIEGLPGVILEAMHCRTPVVAYNVGGISEIVKNGETGWLVRAGDEKSFAGAINQILLGSHNNVIENAYQMSLSKFDNIEIAKSFLEIYERLIYDV